MSGTVTDGPIPIEIAVRDCRIWYQRLQCDSIGKVFPTLKPHLRKCDAESLCNEDRSLTTRSISYVNGAVEATADGLKGAGNFLFEKFIQEPANLNELAKKCDAAAACKRAIAADIPWRKASTDADLKDISSLRLESEKLVADGLEKMRALGSAAANCLRHPINSLPSQEDLARAKRGAEAKANAFFDWAAQKEMLLGFQYFCVDAAGKAQLHGYIAASVVDPLALYSTIRRGEILSRLPNTEKLAAAEAARLEQTDQQRTEARALERERLAKERRTGEPQPPKSRAEPRVPAREQFIEDNLNFSPATPEMNEAFVKIAERETGEGATRFYDVENSLIKPLNDKTNDKNLVTAMTNYHKRLLLEELKELEKRNPGLEITMYSDFKSVRFAASGRVPRNIDEQVQELLKKVDASFAEKIKGSELIRHSDPEFKTPERWFRAGTGPTADQANLSARLAREQKTSNHMLNFDAPELHTDLSRRLVGVDSLRSNVARSLKSTPLLERIPGTAKTTLSREAFDLTRKYPEATALRDAIRKRYGKPDFSLEQAKKMLSYAKATDEFSPGIHVIKREIVNLDSAEYGGFSADFLGLGSSNQRGTAEALARAKNLKDALVQTRRAEKEVTAEFKSRIDRFKQIAGDFVNCSGDDCVGVARRPMTSEEKRELLKRLAADDKTRGIRLSFVSEGVPVPADRTTLSTHGESIEKLLRKKLEGDVQHQRLQKAIFAIDMKAQRANAGPVHLVVATQDGIRWTPGEWKAIQKAFDAAVSAHNANLEKEGIGAAYKATHSTCDAVAGAAACAAPLFH